MVADRAFKKLIDFRTDSAILKVLQNLRSCVEEAANEKDWPIRGYNCSGDPPPPELGQTLILRTDIWIKRFSRVFGSGGLQKRLSSRNCQFSSLALVGKNFYFLPIFTSQVDTSGAKA